MFDASTRRAARALFADDARATRRLRELLRPERVALARQGLTSGALLAAGYFEDQDARVADFESNKVAVWGSVADGNLRHLQRDVGALVRRARELGRPLHVFAGAHGTASARAGAGRTPLFLAGARFPVPKYIWTVVHDERERRAAALVLLNDPFVAVSEIRDAVFCDSRCSRVRWLRELRRNGAYEVPLYGLVFCCDVAALAGAGPAVPPLDVRAGDDGLLAEPFD